MTSMLSPLRRETTELNNLLPNTRKQQVLVRAKHTKNQQDSQPASTYEPGGRKFESCRAHQYFSDHYENLRYVSVTNCHRHSDTVTFSPGRPLVDQLIQFAGIREVL